jgi:chromosome segregation ATPase
VENQVEIQELQRQLENGGIEIGGLQKDLTSLLDLEQRLEDLEKSNQNTFKTLLDELSKMQKEMGELRKKLMPQEE